MTYNLDTTLNGVAGIGEKIFYLLKDKHISTVGDLLLNLPLHYVDRSQIGSIKDLNPEKEITFEAVIASTSNFYKRGLSIQSASVFDETSKIRITWFNNPFILQKLVTGEKFLFSGKLNKQGKLVQPVVEGLGADAIHTSRIVPVYSSTLGLKIGSLRRILKKIIDNLQIETKGDLSSLIPDLKPLQFVLAQLHYPDSERNLIKARERLALEELLSLIKKSNEIKKAWQAMGAGNRTALPATPIKNLIPKSIPFSLTTSQKRSLDEIITDLGKSVPMNRLLLGDVGSGKTVVAGLASRQILLSGKSVALIAPTRILAGQHYETLTKLFPRLKIELVQTQTGKTGRVSPKKSSADPDKPGFYIGTHGLINRLKKINPALIIYDEQHRFGVTQRSKSQNLATQPHILTMTATPIPRSLILTIFSHLSLSTIDEMPAGRLSVVTWLVPEKKRLAAYDWLAKVASRPQQIIFICPFIEKSDHEAFGEVSAVSEKFKEISQYFGKKNKIAMLHGQMKKEDQTEITTRLFAQKIDILVTTPIVEVGIDLPTANFIVIENADRFGLASLHQLRGRVGRRSQQGYCLLFTPSKTAKTKQRLKIFAHERSGLKLAEFDLKNRGAGNIFGIEQSGFDNLRFANWANLALISQARKIYNQIEGKQWQPLLKVNGQKSDQTEKKQTLPLAN